MPVVKVKNLKNEVVGELSLSDKVFGADLNKALIWEAVKEFRANGRRGTVATKTRGDVSGAGRKLWRQKGTGRARIASLRSPLWKGGGNVHGPQPRDWGYKMPQKQRHGAIRSALSERLREGGLQIVESFDLADHKTKQLAGVLSTIGAGEGHVLVIDSIENRNLQLASRNLPTVKHTNGYGLNIYDILRHERIVLSKRAVEEVERILGA